MGLSAQAAKARLRPGRSESVVRGFLKRVVAWTLAMAAVWAQDASAKRVESPPPKPLPVKEHAIQSQMQSLDRQRQSIEKQWAAARQQYPPFFVPSQLSAAPAPPDCEPAKQADVKALIEKESAKQKIDPKVVQAVVEAESAYVPCAVSPVGAMGLMQLMPATADELGVSDPYNAEQNVAAGTQYLKLMLDRYGGDLAKALAAYNAGPSRVDAAKGIPPIPETQEYVRKIMGKISPPSPVQ